MWDTITWIKIHVTELPEGEVRERERNRKNIQEIMAKKLPKFDKVNSFTCKITQPSLKKINLNHPHPDIKTQKLNSKENGKIPERSKRKTIHHVKGNSNIIKIRLLIRNSGGQKAVGWHIQGADITKLSTKNIVSSKTIFQNKSFRPQWPYGEILPTVDPQQPRLHRREGE